MKASREEFNYLKRCYTKRINPETNKNYTNNEAAMIVTEHLNQVGRKKTVSKKKKYDKKEFKNEFEMMIKNSERGY